MTTGKQPNAKKTAKVHLRDGRDEMNLVEFPFATLSERASGDKILEFQTECFDRELGKRVCRKLTVTGDAKFGLPTAIDEEVYLGLLQLTKLHNEFADPKVLFTRSELIQLMGWKNRDWSYHRIATALNRLTGVRLFYDNAWRDNEKKKFRSRGGFGLLDSFELRDGRVRAAEGGEGERLSEFRWNSVIFESFQAGYLKKLDYARVRELGAVARRIYRYLDKHFHPPHRATLVLNLKSFAFEHVGISRGNDASQVKRALQGAIRELERIHFLQVDENRFRKVSSQRGEWEVEFTLVGHRPQRRPVPQLRLAGTDTPKVNVAVGVIDDAVDKYLRQLPLSERSRVEAEAVAQATGFLRETLDSHIDGGPLAEECRRQIVKAFLKTRMNDVDRKSA